MNDDPLLLVGLGNPGPSYERTRHNLGFMLIDELAERWGAPPFSSRCRALHTKVRVALGSAASPGAGAAGHDAPLRTVVLAKPQAFMNRSGESVACLLRELDILPDMDGLWIACDDIDLERSRLRFRRGGGHGGHNGMRSVMGSIGHGEFLRIKLGVGRPPGAKDPADYVLEEPGKKESEEYSVLIAEAADAVARIFRDGLDAVMSEFNRPK